MTLNDGSLLYQAVVLGFAIGMLGVVLVLANRLIKKEGSRPGEH